MNPQILNRESIAPRSSSWQQIEVTGEHAAMLDKRRVIQVIDAESIALMDADFRTRAADPYFDGVLIDADHLSHDPAQKTEAYAWLMNTEIRDGQLWGLVEWTDLGAGAVLNRRYKYFSTEYDAGDLEDLGAGAAGVRKVRPTRLAGLALTNRPNNKGGKKITNRKGDESPEQNPTQKAKAKPMNSIAEKLGLPAEATEEEITAAIVALQERAAKADKMEVEAEAETILNRNAKRFPAADRGKWKERLIKNRASAEEILADLPEIAEEKQEETPAGRPAITNRATAKVPDAARAHGEDNATADEVKASRISNRARELRGQGFTLTSAYSEAEKQIAEEALAKN